MNSDFADIIRQFDINGELISCEPYGSGLINRTYKAEVTFCGVVKRYILQRINSDLFKNVDKLMENITLVTSMAKKRIIEESGNPLRGTLTVIPSKKGLNYIKTETGYFRVYIFIENALGYDKIIKNEHFYECAKAFGKFAEMLKNFDCDRLYETLPDFHNTPKRYENFLKSVEEDRFDRVKDVKNEIRFADNYRGMADGITKLLSGGEIPYRVTHNDTKVNNVLIDVFTDKAVCVIDLDTVMKGSVCYDFGDAIRSGCNTELQDCRDLNKVHLRLDLFEEFCKGYLETFTDITKKEKENLVFSAFIMTYECGIRFLADYLSGDTYFRTVRPRQNLDRCRTQFKLLSEIESKFENMENTVKKY